MIGTRNQFSLASWLRLYRRLFLSEALGNLQHGLVEEMVVHFIGCNKVLNGKEFIKNNIIVLLFRALQH